MTPAGLNTMAGQKKDGDDLTEERLLGQFRAVTADIDFWELVTGDHHHHGGTGLRGP